MPPSCLTDYIAIDNLQIFLDEISQQDGIALRFWSPLLAKGEKSHGWINDEWNNTCNFHTLIRSYPSGKALCQRYFEEKAHEVIQKKENVWHALKCPASLYAFGWPIYDENNDILAILFGGLVRGSKKNTSGKEWEETCKILKKDNALINELENEYAYVPSFSDQERKEVFFKWKLFCELLSRSISDVKLTDSNSDNSLWVEKLISFYNCCTIANSLTTLTRVQKQPLYVTIIDYEKNSKAPTQYPLLISESVQFIDLEKKEKSPEGSFQATIPIGKNDRIALSLDNGFVENRDSAYVWEISQSIISCILINNANALQNRKVLLEQQAHIFENVSKKSVTSLESMIEELFTQLRRTGVINIDFASFSEVVYRPDKKNVTRPYFSATVVYPKSKWKKAQCDIISDLDLYAKTPENKGSTVYAFQKSRTVLDRDTRISPTYIETQPAVKSSLVIPIKYGPVILGVISFDSVEKDYFNDERKLQLESLTQLISPIVYHNSFQKDLHLLNTNIANSAQQHTKESRQNIRQQVLLTLSRLIQAEAASLWEQGKEEGALSRSASIGNVKDFFHTVDINKSAIGKLYREESSHLLVENLKNEDRKNSVVFMQNIQKLIDLNVSSYLAFPVCIGNKKIILSFYRFNHPELINRAFSEVELTITQRLGEILSFYETLNEIFNNHESELKSQIESREELAITLAHNIKSPLSSTYARLDDLQRRTKSQIGKVFFTDNYDSLFNDISSNFSAIKRSTNVVLKQLSLQEQYASGLITAQAFHLYYDILSRQAARVRRGLKIQDVFQKRTVIISGHKQFPILYGDKTSIEDMISNLLENAVKYSNEGSKIYLETSFDYISREIHLLIKNEGKISIPKEDQQRIFEYAYRSKMARDVDPSSTGVGLYYSRFIAEKHGAKLTVEKLHDPVTFKLSLPINLLYSAEKAEETLCRDD